MWNVCSIELLAIDQPPEPEAYAFAQRRFVVGPPDMGARSGPLAMLNAWPIRGRQTRKKRTSTDGADRGYHPPAVGTNRLGCMGPGPANTRHPAEPL